MQTVDGTFSSQHRDRVFEEISRRGQIYFVQIGAMDGYRYDPINPFVRRYGWHGVVVEPLRDHFTELWRTYGDCTGIRFENAAVDHQTGRAMMYRVQADAVNQGRAPDWARGIASLHRDRNPLGGKNTSEENFARIRPHVVEEEVATITLDDLLAKHSVQRIDVFQVDTEGHDYQVLKQLDFSRFRPWVVHMEYINLPADEQEASIRLLRKNGFKCYLNEHRSFDLLAISYDSEFL